MIRFENVSKEYIDSDVQLKKSFKEKLFSKKAKKTVIQDLNLEINEGEIVGYIGENGAGKSMTIKMLLGIIPADSGNITVFEKESFKNRRKNASEIGVMFGQKSHLWWVSNDGLKSIFWEFSQLGNYPISIYPQWLKAVLMIIPFSFIGYFPVHKLLLSTN